MLARGAKRGQRIGNKIRMDGVIGSSNKSNALSSINASKWIKIAKGWKKQGKNKNMH